MVAIQDFDILAKPVTHPTKQGAILTVVSIGSFLAYAIYACVQASNTILSTTSIFFTQTSDISNTVPLRFKCPANTSVSGVNWAAGSYSQTFTHCLVYSSTCPSIGLTFIPAGQTKAVDVCVQTNSFQTMLAMGDKVPCSFDDPTTSSILPFWRITTSNPMRILELQGSINGSMTPAGDTYLLNQVGSSATLVSTNSGPPYVSSTAKYSYLNFSDILTATCSNAVSLNQNYASAYRFFTFTDSEISNLASSARNYSFFSINYKQSSISQLASSPLGVAGSISGAWGGIIALFGVVYTLLLMKTSVPAGGAGVNEGQPTTTSTGKVVPEESHGKGGSGVKKSAPIDDSNYLDGNDSNDFEINMKKTGTKKSGSGSK